MGLPVVCHVFRAASLVGLGRPDAAERVLATSEPSRSARGAGVTSLTGGNLGRSGRSAGVDVPAPGFHGVAASGEEVGSGVGGFGGIGDGVGAAGFGTHNGSVFPASVVLTRGFAGRVP